MATHIISKLSILVLSAGILFGFITAAQAQSFTVERLNPSCLTFTTDFARGTRSAEVVTLQKFLVAEGYLGGDTSNVTGYFGPLTAGSLQAFQASRSIPQTGKADVLTRAAIMMASCGELLQDFTRYVPLFRGIHGPTSARLGEQNTWAAIVNNEYSAYFTTSVSWGDGSVSKADTVRAQASHAQIFTHAYNSAGTYEIIFTVENPSGKKNTSHVSVVVN